MQNVAENRVIIKRSEVRRDAADRRVNQERRDHSKITVAKSVDTRGDYCPSPLMELMHAMENEPVGSVIEVLTSDIESANEIPYWTEKTGHVLLAAEPKEGYQRILVRKEI